MAHFFRTACPSRFERCISGQVSTERLFRFWRCFTHDKKPAITCGRLASGNAGPKAVTPTIGRVTDDAGRMRNIGILAHIDAGKTTTTERMLFYSGETRHIGNVDAGDTVTDYLPEERERGITINSVCVSFEWNKHVINLVDTPGHVDFTVEVERCLCALDGVVIVLDAVHGVQAQTLTVYRQAKRFDLPVIFYLNKMDRPHANVDMCLNHIREKLRANPILMNQLLSPTSSVLDGLVNLLDGQRVRTDHREISKDERWRRVVKLPGDAENINYAENRQKLVDQLADTDDEKFGEFCITEEFDKLPTFDPKFTKAAKQSLRRACIGRKACPTLLGSSFKNEGVVQLLDAIVDYFPSPREAYKPFLPNFLFTQQQQQQDPSAPAKKVSLPKTSYAYVFKNQMHAKRGLLSFARIFHGELRPNDTLFNINQNGVRERVSRVLFPFADEFFELPSATSGFIVALSGMERTLTGDTLVNQNFYNEMEQQQPQTASSTALPLPASISASAVFRSPPPVYFCTIEGESLQKQRALDAALDTMQKEDPSLKVSVDNDTGQIKLAGMGELHLEIVQAKLLREYKLTTYLGPLQVAYLENPLLSMTRSLLYEKNVAGAPQRVELQMRIEPLDIYDEREPIEFLYKPVAGTALQSSEAVDWARGQYNRDMLHAVENGARLACNAGPLLGYPVAGVRIILERLDIAARKTTMPPSVAAAAMQLVQEMFRGDAGTGNKATSTTSFVLLEPVMKVQVTVPQDYLQPTLAELSKRRCTLGEMESLDEGTRIVHAEVPLAEMTHFSRDMRVATSGRANFSIQLGRYEQVNAVRTQRLLQGESYG